VSAQERVKAQGRESQNGNNSVGSVRYSRFRGSNLHKRNNTGQQFLDKSDAQRERVVAYARGTIVLAANESAFARSSAAATAMVKAPAACVSTPLLIDVAARNSSLRSSFAAISFHPRIVRLCPFSRVSRWLRATSDTSTCFLMQDNPASR